jgi:hypothetical protein
MTDHVTTHQAEEDARNDAILIWVNGRILPKAASRGLGLRLGLHAGRWRVGGDPAVQRALGLS